VSGLSRLVGLIWLTGLTILCKVFPVDASCNKLSEKILYTKACCETIEKYDLLSDTFMALNYEIDCLNKYFEQLDVTSESYSADITSATIYKTLNNLYKINFIHFVYCVYVVSSCDAGQFWNLCSFDDYAAGACLVCSDDFFVRFLDLDDC
jgi:hypothetical protein